MNIEKTTISSVEKLDNYDDEYVYDIGVDGEDPYFFANDILIHNSVYFSAFPVLEKEIKEGKIPWDKESVIQLYDQICEQANSTFGDFMLEAFHCPSSRSGVIQAGREIVAQSGLYITKKRYAALVIDDEGKRTDVDGKSGKVKAMGLDLRRSDTPVYMQDYLKEVLLMVLEDYPKDEILERITEIRQEFKEMPSWEKGTPKKVNNLTTYQDAMKKNTKATVPGHVRASLNWNTLKKMNSDTFSQDIVDGMKVIVCKLKNNPMNYTSIAYPVDQLYLPEWFKELNFDDDTMEETIIDKKLRNLIGVLNYDLERTKRGTTFNSLFDW